MSEREIILVKREQIENSVVVIDKYLNSLKEDELFIKNTEEYSIMRKMICKLNALNSALENCV